MTTIYYDESGCGSGKTKRALDTIYTTGGRHLYASDRIEAIQERVQSFRQLKGGDHTFTEEIITSAPDMQSVTPAVRARIEAVPMDFAHSDNIVVFITHEALKLANFDDFAGKGWSLWIDEVPSVVDDDSHAFYLGWTKLAEFYRLNVGADGWSEVLIENQKIDVAALANCEAYEVLRPFHRRVADPRRQVFARIADWDELGVKKRRIYWYSVWSPDELRAFDAVFMLGNSLRKSLTFQIWQRQWPEVEWEPMQAPLRFFKPRRVTITYFAESHVATRKLFGSDVGKGYLAEIARFMRVRRYDDRNLIWTCNSADRAVLGQMPGKWLRPKKAGSNALAEFTSVAAIYTSKPDDSRRKALEKLGVGSQCYIETVEYETILQFMCRGSIREPEDQRDFNMFVYDKKQAEHLAACLRDDPRGYVIGPEVVLQDLGFAFEVRDGRRGPKPKVPSLAEQAAKKARRRALDKLRKRRARAAARKALPTAA